MSASSSLQLAKELHKQLKLAAPEASRCVDLLKGLETEIITKQNIPLHKLETFRNTLTKAQKSFRVQKRGASNGDDGGGGGGGGGGDEGKNKQIWNDLLQQTSRLLKGLQHIEVNTQPTATTTAATATAATATIQATERTTPDTETGLPSSKGAYLSRLKTQKKELYKNPPVLPPAKVVVEADYVGLPQRNKKTGSLTFPIGQDELSSSSSSSSSLKELLKDFHPNQTPEEVLRGGAFGGTYFRTIVSAVTNQRYSGNQVVHDTLPTEWIHGLDAKMLLTSSTYRPAVNKFKSKCGGSLGMWESSGWISDVDPYGWFQWYCFFYQGRRCSDDARQIARWKGVAGTKGRFRSQLCNKILKAKTRADDTRISPVIRQTLFHWGLLITEDILEQHRTRMAAGR